MVCEVKGAAILACNKKDLCTKERFCTWSNSKRLPQFFRKSNLCTSLCRKCVCCLFVCLCIAFLKDTMKNEIENPCYNFHNFKFVQKRIKLKKNTSKNLLKKVREQESQFLLTSEAFVSKTWVFSTNVRVILKAFLLFKQLRGNHFRDFIIQISFQSFKCFNTTPTGVGTSPFFRSWAKHILFLINSFRNLVYSFLDS